MVTSIAWYSTHVHVVSKVDLVLGQPSPKSSGHQDQYRVFIVIKKSSRSRAVLDYKFTLGTIYRAAA